jgi:hypothetical protein
LEQALDMLRRRLAPALTLVPEAEKKSIAEWKAALGRVPLSPSTRVFDASRFCRLMKGRLQFYAQAPAHFDSTWPIENELRRLKQSFFDVPFGVFWEVRTGRKVADPATVLSDICPSLFTAEESRCVREFVRLTPGQWAPGAQKQTAQAVADIFDGFFIALNKVTAAVAEGSQDAG